MYEWLDAVRILLSFSFLAASSWQDLKKREVSNRMWILFAPSGFILSFADFHFTEDGSFMVLWPLSFSVTTGLSLIFFYLGLFGGADAKALISLSIALPVYPSSVDPWFNVVSPFFPLTVLSNALLGSLSMIFIIGSYNLFKTIQTKGKIFEGLEKESPLKKALAFIVGFKVDLDRLKGGAHYIPLEYFSKNEDGRIIRHLRISPRLDEETLQEKWLEEIPIEIPEKIWATPGLPFLVFVTAGFVATLIAGDIITWLVIQLVTPGLFKF